MGSKKQAPLAEKLAYTVAEAGSLIGVCQRTVYSLIESGELKSVKFRKTRRVTPEAIREMLPEFIKAGVKIVPVSELVR